MIEKEQYEIMKQLQGPFKKSQIEYKPTSSVFSRKGYNKNTNQDTEEYYVRVAPYIKIQAVQERFENVFGLFGSSWKTRIENDSVICTIEVVWQGKSIIREDGCSLNAFETNDNVDNTKAAITIAYRRAARHFGVTRAIWNLKPIEVKLDPTRSLWNKEYQIRNKQGVWFGYDAPILPKDILFELIDDSNHQNQPESGFYANPKQNASEPSAAANSVNTQRNKGDQVFKPNAEGRLSPAEQWRVKFVNKLTDNLKENGIEFNNEDEFNNFVSFFQRFNNTGPMWKNCLKVLETDGIQITYYEYQNLISHEQSFN